MELKYNNTNKLLTFRYSFLFNDGNCKEFLINLNPLTLNYLPLRKSNKKFYWTKLTFFRCNNCPLDTSKHKYCPIAVNFIELYEYFSSICSYNKATVILSTEERSYSKVTSIQQSLSSMLGIIMVTSGCPVMERLKPMVRFHLPFATTEETIFRSVSVYLLGQYFSQKRGLKVDLNLNNLKKFYHDIQKVNVGFVNRLRAVTKRDAIANAIILLDAFAKELSWSIEEQLQEIEYLFDANSFSF